MATTRKLLYPDSLSGSLPPVTLTDSLEKIYVFGTALPMGHIVPLLFEAPSRVLIRVESTIGYENNWIRAGSLAQVLYGLPGDPKKQVKRLYLDEVFFELDGAGHPYYLEFWALRWLADYYLEIWAQQA